MTLLSTTTFAKGKTVVERHLFGAFVRKRLIPAPDSDLAKKGIAYIIRDSDDKLIRVRDSQGKQVLRGTPQEVRPFFQLLKKLPNLIKQ